MKKLKLFSLFESVLKNKKVLITEGKIGDFIAELSNAMNPLINSKILTNDKLPRTIRIVSPYLEGGEKSTLDNLKNLSEIDLKDVNLDDYIPDEILKNLNDLDKDNKKKLDNLIKTYNSYLEKLRILKNIIDVEELNNLDIDDLFTFSGIDLNKVTKDNVEDFKIEKISDIVSKKIGVSKKSDGVAEVMELSNIEEKFIKQIITNINSNTKKKLRSKIDLINFLSKPENIFERIKTTGIFKKYILGKIFTKMDINYGITLLKKYKIDPKNSYYVNYGGKTYIIDYTEYERMGFSKQKIDTALKDYFAVIPDSVESLWTKLIPNQFIQFYLWKSRWVFTYPFLVPYIACNIIELITGWWVEQTKKELEQNVGNVEVSLASFGGQLYCLSSSIRLVFWASGPIISKLLKNEIPAIKNQFTDKFVSILDSIVESYPCDEKFCVCSSEEVSNQIENYTQPIRKVLEEKVKWVIGKGNLEEYVFYMKFIWGIVQDLYNENKPEELDKLSEKVMEALDTHIPNGILPVELLTKDIETGISKIVAHANKIDAQVKDEDKKIIYKDEKDVEFFSIKNYVLLHCIEKQIRFAKEELELKSSKWDVIGENAGAEVKLNALQEEIDFLTRYKHIIPVINPDSKDIYSLPVKITDENDPFYDKKNISTDTYIKHLNKVKEQGNEIKNGSIGGQMGNVSFSALTVDEVVPILDQKLTYKMIATIYPGNDECSLKQFIESWNKETGILTSVQEVFIKIGKPYPTDLNNENATKIRNVLLSKISCNEGLRENEEIKRIKSLFGDDRLYGNNIL